MNKLSVRNLDVVGKKVFVRVDFNIPLTDSGKISSDGRIRAALPTIQLLLKKNAILILASHLGKPKGKTSPGLTLKPVATRLSEILNRDVIFAPDCIGPEVNGILAKATPGTIIMLENLRFHPGEKANDPKFCKELASLADRYVDDAFGTAHRAHASTTGMAAYFDRPAAGLLMEKEIEYLKKVTEFPAKPFMTVIGGSKVSDKIGVIANLLPKVDKLLVGGGAVFNFLAAKGKEIGKSIHEPDMVDQTRELTDNPKLILPVDIVIAPSIDSDTGTTVSADAIPKDQMGLDIGPETSRLLSETLATARTVVWVGPMGVFEKNAFAHGTEALAHTIADLTEHGATTVVGGGDTVAALEKFGMVNKVSHASTGGGACLKFLQGKTLPSIAALADTK